jgi:predicted transcriptional regulator of viral defense system
MPRVSRLSIAKADIVHLFDGESRRVYRRADLAEILKENREGWRLTKALTVARFADYLIKNSELRVVAFTFPRQRELRYTWGERPLHEVAVTLRPGAYLTHFSALVVNDLTLQVSKAVYVNSEQTAKPRRGGALVQGRVDWAFQRPPRETTNVATVGDSTVHLLNGMATDGLGVEERPGSDGRGALRVTSLERTLVDCAVRPFYAGGVGHVLEAYRAAKGRASVNRIAAYLKKLDYVYPYHQAIGFYLERAGFEATQLDLLAAFPIRCRFYLTHQMQAPELSERWQVWHPRGF